MQATHSPRDPPTSCLAEVGSARVAGKRPKQDEKPEKQKAKKQKQTEAGASAVVPSSSVEPSHRAMSALVTFLHSFVELVERGRAACVYRETGARVNACLNTSTKVVQKKYRSVKRALAS